jgi:hypothetical protein
MTVFVGPRTGTVLVIVCPGSATVRVTVVVVWLAVSAPMPMPDVAANARCF